MKLTKTLVMMTAVVGPWGCGEGVQEPTQPANAQGDTGQVEGGLVAGDPMIGYWTAGSVWNVRMYYTGTGYWQRSPDEACYPSGTVAWNLVTFQWQDAAGAGSADRPLRHLPEEHLTRLCCS